MSVSTAGTSNDAVAATRLRQDARAPGCVVTLDEDQGASARRLSELKEAAIEAYAACAKRAVDLNADWIAERCAMWCTGCRCSGLL